MAPNPAKLLPDALREAALRYLDRQDASVHQVRTVLRRRIYRYGDNATRAEAQEAIEQLLVRLQESRILDDTRFARGLAESQRRRGASLLKLKQKMKLRGLPPEIAEQALDSLDGDDAALSEEGSARTYARKRRLAQRFDLSDPQQRQKALASLARQGFSFDIARRVLEL